MSYDQQPQPQQPQEPQQPQYQPPYPPQQPQYQQAYPPQYAPVPPKKSNCLMYGLIGGGVLLALCVVVALATGALGGKLASTVQTLATQVAQFTPVVGSTPASTVPPAAAAPTAPPYTEIAAQKSALTAAQLDPYVKSLAGARINSWTGTTIDVATKIFSTDVYQILVDITGPTDNAFKNPQAYIDITKDQAASISKGKAITFSGTVDHVDCTLICTVEVKDATYTVK